MSSVQTQRAIERGLHLHSELRSRVLPYSHEKCKPRGVPVPSAPAVPVPSEGLWPNPASTLIQDFNDRVDIRLSLCDRLQALGFVSYDVLKRVCQTFDATKIAAGWKGAGKNNPKVEEYIRDCLKEKFGNIAGGRADDIVHRMYQWDRGGEKFSLPGVERPYGTAVRYSYLFMSHWKPGPHQRQFDSASSIRSKVLVMVKGLIDEFNREEHPLDRGIGENTLTWEQTTIGRLYLGDKSLFEDGTALTPNILQGGGQIVFPSVPGNPMFPPVVGGSVAMLGGVPVYNGAAAASSPAPPPPPRVVVEVPSEDLWPNPASTLIVDFMLL